MKTTHALVVLFFVALCPRMIQAAVVTVDVTIKAVNPQARGITVVYKTELGEKTIELDVSRKAEIALNGKEGTLDSLAPGLKAKVSYDKDLAVVTKIEATGVIVKRPELVAVTELRDAGANWLNCVSEDGLIVYWIHAERGKFSTIWTAHRPDPQSPFADKKELFRGGSVTVSADGLEMILGDKRSDGQKGSSLYVAKRSAPDQPFEQPAEIPELVKFFNGEPCLSSDCLTLYASRPGPQEQDSTSFVYSTRKDRSSPWSNPKPLYKINVEYGHLGDPFLTPVLPKNTIRRLYQPKGLASNWGVRETMAVVRLFVLPTLLAASAIRRSKKGAEPSLPPSAPAKGHRRTAPGQRPLRGAGTGRRFASSGSGSCPTAFARIRRPWRPAWSGRS